MKRAVNIHIQGLVQGVGFRPFVYRTALKYGVKGTVENRNDGVFIYAVGHHDQLNLFANALRDEAPAAADIYSLDLLDAIVSDCPDFSIVRSADTGQEITEVSPDIAVCEACLHDMKHQPHRINYPMTNCTNCGPRFTIIRSLPYDRPNTTMDDFSMCPQCAEEYRDVLNRRFHAQPVACNHCGPVYSLHLPTAEKLTGDSIAQQTALLIDHSKVVAIKGMGGFHLACDAFDLAAVDRLRQIKQRDGKPFAVMFRDAESATSFVSISDQERELLTSWRRPVVLLQAHKLPAPAVSNGFSTLGVMLPYMPFHYQLFEQLNTTAIVLTSGNITDDPIVINNEEALRIFGTATDAVVTYNREIYNRTDDSVAMVVNGRPRLIRRSRGYAPSPIRVDANVEGIVAMGAELTSCFCFGKKNMAMLSQHIGDLKNQATLEFFEESYYRQQKLFRASPTLAVCDLHPDYLSTRFAEDTGLPLLRVQHHHAHIAAVMAEHRISSEVIGVAMDGTGYGSDGTIWGGEFMICGLDRFERKAHFPYLPLPGGDLAIQQPWRTALSVLYMIFGKDLYNLDIPFVHTLNKTKSDILLQAIDKKINSPLSCSAGRWFDAVSALCGLCHTADFHAEAPMRLEAVIQPGIKSSYEYDTSDTQALMNVLKQLIDDLIKQTAVPVISAKFHNTIIKAIFEHANSLRNETGINRAVLSGGSFQNRYLLCEVENILGCEGFECYSPDRIPGNDAGVALGQLIIASERRKLCV
jgi:hydrogenase maturation protein HypF